MAKGTYRLPNGRELLTFDTFAEHVQFNRHILQEQYRRYVSLDEAALDIYGSIDKMNCVLLTAKDPHKFFRKFGKCIKDDCRCYHDLQTGEKITDTDKAFQKNKKDEINPDFHFIWRTSDGIFDYLEPTFASGNVCSPCMRANERRQMFSERGARENPLDWLTSRYRYLFPWHMQHVPEKYRPSHA